MDDNVKDKLIVMPFTFIGEDADRTGTINVLLEKRAEIESVFKNDEFLVLDLTHQELLGLKSTATFQNMPIGDLVALNQIIRRSERHKGSKTINLGNVSAIYQHYSD